MQFKKISIVYNASIEATKPVVEQVSAVLDKFGIDYILQELIPDKTKKTTDFERDIDLAIVIGGDGTLISVGRFYAQFDVSVFGINVGRLGFLAQLQLDEVEQGIERLVRGEYKVDERLMLKAFVDDGKFSFNALNDIVIKGGAIARTERLYLYINDELVCDYLADGLIISTPTGSTAYTLSAGGPIITPGLDVIIIVPICPHSLNVRPLVIPSSEKISVKLGGGDDEVFITADGQKSSTLKKGNIVHIEKNEHNAKLALLEDNFYSVLKEKLHWGISPKS